MFTVSPSWTRLDTGITGLRVNHISIERGRSSEFENTDTGTCTVEFNDTVGYLDPTLSASLISTPFAVAIRNPITDEWFPLFRGVVDQAGYIMSKHTRKLAATIVAVDAFDYFANFELIPGLAGFSNAQINAAGYVFYEDAGFDERLNAILGDCNWPVGLSSTFTGNIVCSESRYASGDRALQALQECVDAEFPTVANHYVDKRGIYQVHGRKARFIPDFVAASASNWDFHRWKVGDNAAARADTGEGGTAKMQEPYQFSQTRQMIRNAALAYPMFDVNGLPTDQSDLSDYIYTDETSRDSHGTKTWTAPNLKVAEEPNLGLTGKETCLKFSEYIVENYKDPFPRLSSVTVGTEWPDHDVFGPASYEYICGADISDIVSVTIDHPGGGGFLSSEYYIEGLRIDIRPGPGDLDNAYPIIKHTADLSPAAYWNHNPFGDFAPGFASAGGFPPTEIIA